MDEKQDVYTRITNKIIADLERGNLTWLQPWQAGHAAGEVSRPLRSTGERYQGVNVLMLWAAAMENGYVAPIWMTFNQAKQLCANVRKGEHGSLVVFADIMTKTVSRREGRRCRKAYSFYEGLHRFQRGAD